jgi:transposase
MMQSTTEFAALVGIDWSDTKHAFCVQAVGGEMYEQGMIGHTPEAIETWARGLAEQFPGQQIAVCLEQSKGSLIYALLKYDFLVLYPVNPRTLAKFREAFAPSGAKDDPTDAQLALELLRKHRDKLRSWRPADPQTRTLRLLVEQRRKLVNDKTRLLNRLTSTLKGYFPQILTWFQPLDTRLVYAFLQQWSTLEAVQQADDHTLLQFFLIHHSKRQSLNQRRLAAIRQAIPATTDRAVVTASVMVVHALLEQIRCLVESIRGFDRQIDARTRTHVDVAICASLPGAGQVHASRLISALGTDRSRYERVEDLLTFAGIAPVVERSGRAMLTHVRWFCPTFLRQSFHEFAGQSIRHCLWAKAYYRQQRTRGKAHHAAVRALAFKWTRIIFRCWKSHTPYDEQIYLAALEKRGSSLLKLMSEIPV